MVDHWLALRSACVTSPRTSVGRTARAMAVLILVSLTACSSRPRPCSPADVSTKVRCRTGYSFRTVPCDGRVVWPNGASLADGLTEDEAVLIALWNNAAFQELLTDLGIARGDLVQAGLLPNPEVVYFFPVSDKPFKYAFDLPIEAFWLRPIRVAAARRESARVCNQLTQSALNLIRDVRQSYADVLLARGQLRVAEEGVQIWGRIAELAETRLKAGDISVQEAAAAKIDALRAQQDAARIAFESPVAEQRLRNLMGTPFDGSPLAIDDTAPPVGEELDVDLLTAEAVAARPDALAAQQNAAAAAERSRLARIGWVRLLGIGDATSGTRTGHEFGPAIRVTLPLFHRNQGNIARADAEWEKARRHRIAVRDQIVLDVRQAHYRYAQARAEFAVLDTRVRPDVEAAIRRAQRAYLEGQTSYIVVLETTRRLLDARLRQEQLHAELRRSWAELERSVGRRLSSSSVEEVAQPDYISPQSQLLASERMHR